MNAHKKPCASEKKLMASFLIGRVCSIREFKSLAPTRPPGIFNFKRDCSVLSFIHMGRVYTFVVIEGEEAATISAKCTSQIRFAIIFTPAIRRHANHGNISRARDRCSKKKRESNESPINFYATDTG